MGKYTNDPTYDVIRSGAPAGLLLSAANGNVHIWGRNNLHLGNNLNVSGSSDITGNSVVKGNSEVKGTQYLAQDIWHKSLGDNRDRIKFDKGSTTIFGSGTGYQWNNAGGNPNMDLNTVGDLNLTGGLTANTFIQVRSRNNTNNVFRWHSDWGDKITLRPEKTFANGNATAGGPDDVMSITTHGSITLRPGAAYCINGQCINEALIQKLMRLPG
jgi:hypothetical protein